MSNTDSRMQVTSLVSMVGQPVDAALAEQWQCPEIRARVMKLVRPMLDLLPPQSPEPMAAQAKTICHLSRDKRWQIPGTDWQITQRMQGWYVARRSAAQPSTTQRSTDIEKNAEQHTALTLNGLSHDVAGMSIGKRPLPLAFWTLAAARHRGERHAELAIEQISSVREALCWGELIGRLRAPDGHPPRVALTLSDCEISTLEASLYFLLPWLDSITLIPATAAESDCLGVLEERFQLTPESGERKEMHDVMCRYA